MRKIMNSNFYSYLLDETNHSYRFCFELPIDDIYVICYYQPNHIKHGIRIHMDDDVILKEIFLNDYCFISFDYFRNKLGSLNLREKSIPFISFISDQELEMIKFYSSYL